MLNKYFTHISLYLLYLVGVFFAHFWCLAFLYVNFCYSFLCKYIDNFWML